MRCMKKYLRWKYAACGDVWNNKLKTCCIVEMFETILWKYAACGDLWNNKLKICCNVEMFETILTLKICCMNGYCERACTLCLRALGTGGRLLLTNSLSKASLSSVWPSLLSGIFGTWERQASSLSINQFQMFSLIF